MTPARLTSTHRPQLPMVLNASHNTNEEIPKAMNDRENTCAEQVFSRYEPSRPFFKVDIKSSVLEGRERWNTLSTTRLASLEPRVKIARTFPDPLTRLIKSCTSPLLWSGAQPVGAGGCAFFFYFFIV